MKTVLNHGKLCKTISKYIPKELVQFTCYLHVTALGLMLKAPYNQFNQSIDQSNCTHILKLRKRILVRDRK